MFFSVLGKFLSFSDKKSQKNFEGRKSQKKKQRKKFWRVEKFSWQKNFGVRKKLKEKNLQNQLKFF